MVEQDLGHLFITSSSSHFFNKTYLEQYILQYPMISITHKHQFKNENTINQKNILVGQYI